MSTYNDPRCRVDNLRRFDEKQLFVLGAELYDPGNISCFMFFIVIYIFIISTGQGARYCKTFMLALLMKLYL